MATKKQYPLDIVIRAVDKVTGPLLGLQRRVQNFTRPFRALGRSLRRFGDAAVFGVMGRALGRVRDSVGGLVRSFGTLLTRMTAIGAAGAALAGKLVLDFAASGRETQAWARRLGISVESLQELNYVAGQYSITQDALIDGLKELSLRSDEFVVTGKGSAAEAFQRLRLSAEELRKTGGDTEKLFDLVIKQMQKVRNVAARQRIADELFGGQGGEQFTELLSESTSEISRLRQEARDLSYVMSEETTKATVEFDRHMRRAKAALVGVRNTIGAQLLPIVQELADRFVGFLLKNRNDIEIWAKRFAESVPTFDQVKNAVMAVVDELRPLINLIRWISDNFGVVNTLLTTFAVVLGGQVIASLLAVIPAIMALGVALLTTPVGWFLAAVAAIAAAVFVIYKNWDGITGYFKGKFDKVKSAFKDGFLKGLWTLVTEFNPIQLIIDSIDALIKKLTGFSIKSAIGGLIDKLNPFSGSSEASQARPAPRMRPGAGVLQSSRNSEQQQAKVSVDFLNLPRGARVEQDRSSTADLDLSMGYQMQGAQ